MRIYIYSACITFALLCFYLGAPWQLGMAGFVAAPMAFVRWVR